MKAKRIKTIYPGVYYREDSFGRMFYIIYRRGGRGSPQIEEPVGRDCEKMTAAQANRIRSDRMRGQAPSNKEIRSPKPVEPTINKLFELYNQAKPDRASLVTDSNLYLNHLARRFGLRLPAEISTAELEQLARELSPRKPQTIKHVLELLRRLINYGVKQGLCARPELSFPMPRVDNKKTENLTPEQMRSYLRALDEEVDQDAAALLRLALTTGMRKGALLALRWNDIDFEHGFITLRGDAAKKGRTEVIPLPVVAAQILQGISRNGEFVFPGVHGGQRRDYSRIARRVRDKAGLPKDFRPLHGLRHTFASWLASSGAVDLYTLQKLLTHESSLMTARYAHLSDAALRRAAEVTDDLMAKVKPVSG